MKNEKPKHTPGPWTVKGDQKAAVWAGKKWLTRFDWGPYENEIADKVEAQANAALAASAPELLAALERVMECHRLKISLDTNFGAVAQARAAIAKAKGE